MRSLIRTVSSKLREAGCEAVTTTADTSIQALQLRH
jgi:hypothetical protein